MGVDELWDLMNEKVQAGWMLTAGSHPGTGDDQDQNSIGIANRHAYTVLNTVQLSDG